jgi:hypothetical protein
VVKVEQYRGPLRCIVVRVRWVGQSLKICRWRTLQTRTWIHHACVLRCRIQLTACEPVVILQLYRSPTASTEERLNATSSASPAARPPVACMYLLYMVEDYVRTLTKTPHNSPDSVQIE